MGTFINKLTQLELSKCLADMGQTSTGTVDEMRVRLRSFIKSPEFNSTHEEVLRPIRDRFSDDDERPVTSKMVTARSTSPNPSQLQIPSSHPMSKHSTSSYKEMANEKPQQSLKSSLPPTEEMALICDKVRKWGVKYEGGKEPLIFIERIEELAKCYNIPLNVLLSMMPELLRNEALLWYRNNRSNWDSYQDFLSDFKLFFLPINFFENLMDDVRKRMQGMTEKFVDYVTNIQSLMRWTDMSSDEQLDRIFKNCRAEYKLYIKRRDFSSLRDLITLAMEFESVKAENEMQQKPQQRVLSAVANPKKSLICYRCAEIGHHQSECTNAQVLFCWDCHKRGIRTYDCCRLKSGNEERVSSNQRQD